MRCKAKSKRSGEQCKRAATPGREVCYIHGGKTLMGVAAPGWKDGRYSKYLPGRLMDRYREAAQDGELLALRDEVALVDARIADLLGRVDSGEAGKHWQAAQESYRAFVNAQADDTETRERTLKVLGEVLGRGMSDYVVWSEVTSLLEQRRKLVESERKRLVEMQQMVTAEQAMTLVAAVIESVRKHVSDRRTLDAIAKDIALLTGRQAG